MGLSDSWSHDPVYPVRRSRQHPRSQILPLQEEARPGDESVYRYLCRGHGHVSHSRPRYSCPPEGPDPHAVQPGGGVCRLEAALLLPPAVLHVSRHFDECFQDAGHRDAVL